MKKAFTLAEVLITIAIIGIVSAITLPVINNLMPDKNKTLYLKTYDTISNTIKELAANSKLYPICKDPDQEDSIFCQAHPLFNTMNPLVAPFKDNPKYSSFGKLCNLLAFSLGVDEDEVSCQNGADIYVFDLASVDQKFNDKKSFTTSNGMQWWVHQDVLIGNLATPAAAFEANIYVDINGDSEPNCIYNEDSCTSPDRFMFMVAANGSVYPADPMGKKYIETRNSLTKRSIETSNNEYITNLANINPELKQFPIVACNAVAEDPEKKNCIDSGGIWDDAAGTCTIPGGGGGGGGVPLPPPQVAVNINGEYGGWAYLNHNSEMTLLYNVQVVFQDNPTEQISIVPKEYIGNHGTTAFSCNSNVCNSYGYVIANLGQINSSQWGNSTYYYYLKLQDNWNFIGVVPTAFSARYELIPSILDNLPAQIDMLKKYNMGSDTLPYQNCTMRSGTDCKWW